MDGLVHFKKNILILEVLFWAISSWLKAIDFDFLDNSKIERIGTKIKKASNIDDVPKVLRNIYFGPLTLKIT